MEVSQHSKFFCEFCGKVHHLPYSVNAEFTKCIFLCCSHENPNMVFQYVRSNLIFMYIFIFWRFKF